MNSEYVLNNVKTILETYIDSMVNTIETEASASVNAPDISQFFIGKLDLQLLTSFPCIYIYADESRHHNDQQGFQERTLKYNVVCWTTQNDLELLHRYVIRYGEAITRVLRKENYYPENLNTPLVKIATYSDLYKSTVGYAYGVDVECNINYFIT